MPDSEGRLWRIRLGNQLDCAEELGRYPIISWETAQKLLLNGDYITSVPENYLPEVSGEYLVDFPTWDGSIN